MLNKCSSTQVRYIEWNPDSCFVFEIVFYCGLLEFYMTGYWLLEIYIRTTSKIILGWALNCDSTHSAQLYSVAPLRNQAAAIITPISHSVILSWHWTNQLLSYPIKAERQIRKQKTFHFISHWFDSTRNQTPDQEARAIPIGHPALFWTCDVFIGLCSFKVSRNCLFVFCYFTS